MIRITDQYVWNFIFGLFFLSLIVLEAIILETEAIKPYAELTITDYVLMALASFRLTRLFVYDSITKFLREQFWDATKVGKEVVLAKPARGPRRTLADLLSCPWCFGMTATAITVFFYLITPYAFPIVLILALSGVATFLQLLSNLVGHKAGSLKSDTNSR